MKTTTERWIDVRGGVSGAMMRFEREKRGTVVFLGGSITEAPGWRDQVCASLRRRFPQTQFRFENSGISSTDSVPGSFRAHRDVCTHGPVDLLFVDAAVNDAANRSGQPHIWLRGMEGIVRHTLAHNPRADIVLLHFADPQKTADYEAGRVPAVIAAHERVAEGYGLTSLHLAREVADRMRAGEFSWEKDFKDLHPSPFGHALYAAAIDRLLDAPSAGGVGSRKPGVLPPPLDPNSYFDGQLVDFRKAEAGPAWRVQGGPSPFIRVQPGQHAYFSGVPELVTEAAGAELALRFDGRAAGVWMWIGPGAGTLDAAVDDGPWRPFALTTPWSATTTLPWVLILADDLPPGAHTLRVRAATASKDCPCKLLAFVVNGQP